MKRMTKRRLSTVIGCVLGGVTFTGPLAGAVLSDWQCRRGLCGHGWHLPKVEWNAEVHMSPDEARALAAALVHYADEADQ